MVFIKRFYPSENNFVTSDMSATGSNGNWSASAEETDLDHINTCPDCFLMSYWAEIVDESRYDDDSCSDYLDELLICADIEYDDSRRRVPSNSQCVAGSGQFQLVPRWVLNKDNDSNRSVILKPIQKSGTGVMTSAAWISNITIIEDQGKQYNVSRFNKAYSFDENDQIVNELVNTIPLLQNSTNFMPGMIPGSTSFLLSEVHKDTIVDFIVDIDWTCGTVLTQEEVYPSQGYTFSLSDVGCVGSWPQKFTMRPLPFGAANRLSIERYGSYQGQETLFLTQGPNGEDLFSYQVGAIDIQGELISYDSTVGASIRIDVAEWDGYTVCTPGTYTLPVEQ
jgi:hypothetical protein